MCSKCHKDLMLKQEQTKLAASTIGSIINGGSSSANVNEPAISPFVDLQVSPVDPKPISSQPSSASISVESAGDHPMPKDGPKRCNTCNKKVVLTGFNCRCGNLFCSVHRYSDKHECLFDYRTAAQEAVSKANPVVKAEKLNKI